MQRKKALFIISSFQAGGAEKQTINLINRIDTSCIKIYCCYLKKEGQLLAEINKNKLSGLYCLDKKRRLDLKALSRLVKIIRIVNPEKVVCVNLYPAFYLHLLDVFYCHNFKIIQIVHTTEMRDFYNELITRFLYIRLIKRCDRLVFVCKSQLEHWIKTYGVSRNMCQHIYNGVDTNYFICTHSIEEKSKLRKSLGIRSSDAVICVCAALRPEKKHADLIDAAKILIEKGIPLKILMIGDGPERNKIERHIKKRGMESIVIATGFKNDVRPFICLSDIVALSSVSVETFSMAILEAMSLGKPIVATAIGGLTELVRHGENGFLVPPGDIKALAESFETIIKNNLFDCMGKRSRKLACDRFNINQMVQGYQELLLQ